MDFDFFMPAKIVSGQECLLRNAELLNSLGTHCGIVTSTSSGKKSGALDDACKALSSCGIPYTIFDQITQNPLTVDCQRAARLFTTKKVDFIMGIGGGSPLDASKAVAILMTNPVENADDIYLGHKSAPLPLCVIGTSSGTGSEVSAVSVLTNTQGRKKSIKGPDLYPKIVFADSRYTCSQPYEVTVSTGLDALAHAIEGYFTDKCTDIPILFANRAIPMLWQGLCELSTDEKKNDSAALHDLLYMGSLYAGIVLNACGTAFPHPCGYVLTENYGIPHGKACSAFMPALMERAERFLPKKHAAVLTMLNETAPVFSQKVTALTKLPDIHMTNEQIEAYCARWHTVPGNFTASPGGFTKEDATALFAQIFA